MFRRHFIKGNGVSDVKLFDEKARVTLEFTSTDYDKSIEETITTGSKNDKYESFLQDVNAIVSI